KEPNPKSPRGIVVRDGDHGLPYSKGLTANTIIASGLSPARAYRVAQEIEDRLTETGRSSVDIGELRRLTIDVIRAEAGDRYAASDAKWISVGNPDIPMIVLIGGGPGAGKATGAEQ